MMKVWVGIAGLRWAIGSIARLISRAVPQPVDKPNQVRHGSHGLDPIIGRYRSKLFFHFHNQLDNVQRLDSQLIQSRLEVNCGRVNVQLGGETIAKPLAQVPATWAWRITAGFARFQRRNLAADGTAVRKPFRRSGRDRHRSRPFRPNTALRSLFYGATRDKRETAGHLQAPGLT
jgi:hypothetical protein